MTRRAVPRGERMCVLALGLALGLACDAAGTPAGHRDDRTVDIAISHAGTTALELEQQLVVPIEHALRRVPGVRAIEARIDAGGAVVSVELANRLAVDARLGEVREAMAALRATLPAEAAPPVVTRRGAPPVLTLAVTGERSLAELSEVARAVVRPRLERLVGVARVELEGGVDTVIAIRPDLARLAMLGVTVADLADAIGAANADVPAGRLAPGTGDVAIRVEARVGELADLGAIPIRAGADRTIHVRDVATIETTTATTTATMRATPRATPGERPGATPPTAPRLVVRPQAGARPDAVVAAVRRELAALAPELPPGVRLGEPELPVRTAPPLVVWLHGDDGDTLTAAATTLEDALRAAGAATFVREPAEGRPTHAITIDRARAAELGVAVATIAKTLRALADSEPIGEIEIDGRTREVVLRPADDRAGLPERLGQVHVATPAGASVPLATLVTVHAELERSILRRDHRRAVRFAIDATHAAPARAVIRRHRAALPAGIELTVE